MKPVGIMFNAIVWRYYLLGVTCQVHLHCSDLQTILLPTIRQHLKMIISFSNVLYCFRLFFPSHFCPHSPFSTKGSLILINKINFSVDFSSAGLPLQHSSYDLPTSFEHEPASPLPPSDIHQMEQVLKEHVGSLVQAKVIPVNAIKVYLQYLDADKMRDKVGNRLKGLNL